MAQGKTFTGQLFLGTDTTDASIQSGTALPVGGNPGDLFMLDTAGVGSLHIYNGSAWVQANTGGGAAGAAGDVQYSDGSGGFVASTAFNYDSGANRLYVYGAGHVPGSVDERARISHTGALFETDQYSPLGPATRALYLQTYTEWKTFDGTTWPYYAEIGFDPNVVNPTGMIIRSYDGQAAYPTYVYANLTIEARAVDLVFEVADGGSRLGGDLRLDGAPGSAGQVLTSSGPNVAPTWTTPAAAGITALTGDVTATGPGSTAASVVRLQGRTLASTAPNNGQVIKWNGTSSQWEPANDAAATPAGADTEIQFNNSGAFGASSLLTWSGTALTVDGSVNIKGGDPRALVIKDIGDAVEVMFFDAAVEALTVQSSVGAGVTTIDAVQVNISDTGHTAQLSVVPLASVNVDLYVPVASAVVPAIVAADSGSTPVPLRLDASGIQIASAGVVGYTLPVTDGANGDVLTTDGAGNVAWAAVPGITSITGDVTATVAAGVATTTLAASGINASNNLGLLEITSSPTQSEADNNAGFRCTGAGPFDLSTLTGADGRRLTFVNDRGNAVDITNGATSRTMSPDGGSTWVYSTAASKWFCTANV
jgi:hypothetical protein